ncbi:hypothetical protein [Streptomyces sp. NPDC029041]
MRFYLEGIASLTVRIDHDHALTEILNDLAHCGENIIAAIR